MPFENGRNWEPLDPALRGRHKSFSSAVEAAFAGFCRQSNPFFDSLADRWESLFPGLPAKPGRYEDGKIFLYVPNAALNYTVLHRLPQIKRALAALPDAPKRIDLHLEIAK